MQKIIQLLLFFFIIAANVKGQSEPIKNRFILTGHIIGMDNKLIFLNYRTINGNYQRDSAKVEKERFEFRGFISEPTRADITNLTTLTWFTNNPNYTSIFIEPTKMNIVIPLREFKQAKLMGSKTQNELIELRKMRSDITKITDPLMKEYDRLNDIYIMKKKAKVPLDTLTTITDKMDSIRKQKKQYDEKNLAIYKSFYKKYPNSFVTVYNLAHSTRDFSFIELNDYYNKMSLKVQHSQMGEDLKTEIGRMMKGLPGRVALNFASRELSGDTLRLSDYKGKYVLLDFWATWCRPCRAGNPELIRLYNRYKDYGLEIIGIADDDSRPGEWKVAIKKDGTGIWKHVLRGHNSDKDENTDDLHELYSIQTLPTKILINTEGEVISRYTEGKEDDEKLSKKLKELFHKD